MVGQGKLKEMEERFGALAEIAMDGERCMEYCNANIGEKAADVGERTEDGKSAYVPDEDEDDFDALCMMACAITYSMGGSPTAEPGFTKEIKNSLIVAYYYGRWVERQNQVPSVFGDLDLGDFGGGE